MKRNEFVLSVCERLYVVCCITFFYVDDSCALCTRCGKMEEKHVQKTNYIKNIIAYLCSATRVKWLLVRSMPLLCVYYCRLFFPACINVHTKHVDKTKANGAHNNNDYGVLYICSNSLSLSLKWNRSSASTFSWTKNQRIQMGYTTWWLCFSNVFVPDASNADH